MTDLTFVVPTRGRPTAAGELLIAFDELCGGDTRLLFVVDSDDPQLPGYEAVVPDNLLVGAHTNMVHALNAGAMSVVETSWAVGFMGDDHRPRTKNWDRRYLKALRELGTGMVYGDDLLQRENLPTQIAMTSDIIQALGWMAPPALVHLAVDNWWLTLGRFVGCIRYLPDVVVEHMHPVAGKAKWDAGHLRVNRPEMYGHDLATFARLRVHELPAAVKAVQALRVAA
jgi:hypothetical protein